MLEQISSTLVVTTLLLCWITMPNGIEATDLGNGSNNDHHETSEGIKVADWKWHELSTFIIITLFILVASILKIIYHHIPILVKYMPESNVLIVFGVVIGVIVFFAVPQETRTESIWALTPELFFLILLPPIILEAAYSLYDRAFIDNIGAIMYFAVGGTVLNFLIIGFSMYGINAAGGMGEPKLNLSMEHGLLFGSFIVAVDPVAVLAIFSEIGVDHGLYYMVFGESLLNDAVTVVLYNMMNSFTVLPTVTGVDIVLGIVSFFTVSLGGALVGIIVGVICCLITRFTYSSKVIEPLVVLVTAYLAYLLGDLFGWSGLIAIITCGVVQAAYVFQNISRKGLVTLKYTTKFLASTGEALIFVYLGIELVKSTHIWHWAFALWALGLCLISRFLVTFASCFVMNCMNRLKKISLTEQFIIGFGGLRGAVAFALVTIISKNSLKKAGLQKEMFVTTTLFIIMFTCIIMGMLIKPVVKCLHIRLEEKGRISVFDEVIDHVADHVTAGVQEIIGEKGESYFIEWFEHINEKFILPILQRNPKTHDQQIVEMYEKVSLKVHEASMTFDKEHYDDMLNHLAPGLSVMDRVPSKMSLQDCNTEEVNELRQLQPQDSYVDLSKKEIKRRLGQKEPRISKNPQANEVRKVMQKAKNETFGPGNFSRTQTSGKDLEQKLHEAKSRAAKGHWHLHLKKPHIHLHLPHVHSKSRLSLHNKHDSKTNMHTQEQDAVADNQDAGQFTARKTSLVPQEVLVAAPLIVRNSQVRFDLDEDDTLPNKNSNELPDIRATSGDCNVPLSYENPSYSNETDENTAL